MTRHPALRAPQLITEADWQTLIIDYARLHGWWVHHVFDSRRSPEGWPDLVLIRPPELIIAELKRQTGKLTPAQARVLTMLEQCGIEVHVWRPSDEPAVFTRLARTPR